MKAERSSPRQSAWAIASPFWAILVALTCLGLFSSVALAQKSKPPEPKVEDFDPSKFDRSTQIDNEWMPLKPGTRLVYAGIAIDNGTPVSRRLVVTITDLTKVIGGIRTVV